MKTKNLALRATTLTLSFALIQVSFGPEAWSQIVPMVGGLSAPVGGASSAAGSANFAASGGGAATLQIPTASLTASPTASTPSPFAAAQLPVPSLPVPAIGAAAPAAGSAFSPAAFAAAPIEQPRSAPALSASAAASLPAKIDSESSAPTPAVAPNAGFVFQTGPRTAGIGARMSLRFAELRNFFSGRKDAGTPSVFASAQENGSPIAGLLTRPDADARSSAAPETPVPEPAPAPASSKCTAALRWVAPVLALSAVIFGVDQGTKALSSHFIYTVFHECSWRAPLLAVVIPFMAVTTYLARASISKDRQVTDWSPLHWSSKMIGNGRFGFKRLDISGLDSMAKEHPSMRGFQKLYDFSIAILIGGMLGNGIDNLRLGGALDWIPFGHSYLNFADINVFLGLSLFQLLTSFSIKAGAAHHDGKPLYFSMVPYLGLPLAGFALAWAGTTSGGPLVLIMSSLGNLYLMGFSMFIGLFRFITALAVNPTVKRFVAELELKNKP